MNWLSVKPRTGRQKKELALSQSLLILGFLVLTLIRMASSRQLWTYLTDWLICPENLSSKSAAQVKISHKLIFYYLYTKSNIHPLNTPTPWRLIIYPGGPVWPLHWHCHRQQLSQQSSVQCAHKLWTLHSLTAHVNTNGFSWLGQ